MTVSTPMHIRDEDYYLHDLVLLVENTLFRVPRFVFQHSPVFQDMLSVPQGDSGTLEGTDDEHPLFLPSYLAADFKQLLRILLPLSQQYPPVLPLLTSSEWMSVLKLSTVWEMDQVRKASIDALDEYAEDDPILRLITAKRYNIPRWFAPAVNKLAQREVSLDEEDYERLSELGSARGTFNFMLKVARLRETFSYSVMSSDCHTNHAVLCRTHDAYVTQSKCPRGLTGRSHHDFRPQIVNIFDCIEEGYVAPELVTEEENVLNSPLPPYQHDLASLVPQSHSWDFA